MGICKPKCAIMFENADKLCKLIEEKLNTN